MQRLLSMSLLFVLANLPVGASAADTQAKAGGGVGGDRIRLVRSWPEPVTVNGKTALGRMEILFDYDQGVAIERLLAADGTVVSSTVRKKGEGAPRPTPEEITEAMDMVRADEELARIIDRTGAELDGGFILNERPGKPCGPGTRCIQIQIQTADRMGLIRWVVVDLT